MDRTLLDVLDSIATTNAGGRFVHSRRVIGIEIADFAALMAMRGSGAEVLARLEAREAAEPPASFLLTAVS